MILFEGYGLLGILLWTGAAEGRPTGPLCCWRLRAYENIELIGCAQYLVLSTPIIRKPTY